MASYKVSDRSVVVSIVVVLCLIYTPYVLSHRAAGIRFLQGDSYYYRAAVVSLLEDGDLLLANNITGRDLLEGEQLALGTRGLVPKHPIIMPLVSLPFYYVLQDRGLLLFNLLDTILLIVLIYKVNRLFFSEYVSFATAQLYATATLFLDYSYNYSPDVFSTVLVLGGLYFALRARYHAGATLLGLAIFAKVSNVVLVAPIVFYMFAVIWRGRRDAEARAGFSAGKLRALLGVCMTFLLTLLPFAYTNYELFGSPFVLGYQRIAVAGQSPGEIAVVSLADRFNQPLLHGAYNLLFHSYDQYVVGIVPTNPILVFALVGVGLIRSTKTLSVDSTVKLWLIVVICACQFLFFAKYDEWWASSFSNRFLMTFIALSSVFTSSFIGYVGEKLFRAHAAAE